jgi:short-subunit dehydrogenase
VALAVSGARALLTGASAGIGWATAHALASSGATLAVTGRRAERLDALLAELPGDGHVAIAADLDDPAAVDALVAGAESAIGPLDVVVHNAGMPMRRPVTQVGLDEVAATMRVNFEAPVRMALATLPGMLERGRGCQVFVSSLGGRLGIIHETAYCASKFALCGWAEAMAVDLWQEPVDVRLVLPGPIDTEIWDRPGSDPPVYDGPKEPPSVVADAIVAAIEGDAFETYAPDLKGIVEWKTSDPDGFLAGAAAMGADEGSEGS